MSRLPVGFIGLGNMGKPMARNLVCDTLEAWVHDVQQAPVDELVALGAHAGSPAEIARHCRVIGLCVRDDRDVEALLYGEAGMLAQTAPGTVIAIHSTVTQAGLLRWAADAAARGIDLIDAPVTLHSRSDSRNDDPFTDIPVPTMHWLFALRLRADAPDPTATLPTTEHEEPKIASDPTESVSARAAAPCTFTLEPDDNDSQKQDSLILSIPPTQAELITDRDGEYSNEQKESMETGPFTQHADPTDSVFPSTISPPNAAQVPMEA